MITPCEGPSAPVFRAPRVAAKLRRGAFSCTDGRPRYLSSSALSFMILTQSSVRATSHWEMTSDSGASAR